MSVALPRQNDTAPPLQLFATTARGTEDLLAAELRQLGAGKIRQDRGGVRFLASLREALWICLWSRIAMRVLYPVGTLDVRGAQGLYDAVITIPWEEMLTPQSTFAVEASLRSSEHRHSGFVSLKIKDAIVDRLRDKLGARPNVDTRDPVVSVIAHLAGERLTLSLDLCGAPLFQRGYRMESTQAPMKETLAAAILRAAEYTGDEIFLDPMCGSGTLLIEAALIASNRAPGLKRKLAVERWPQLGAQATQELADLRERARAAERTPPHPLIGFDKSGVVVKAAQRNAKNAGVATAVAIREGDATAAFDVPEGAPLLIVTNPPYGTRLPDTGQKAMKAFYYKLGDRCAQLSGARIVVLSGNPGFESAFHMRPVGRRQLYNGPIPCALLSYQVPTRPRSER